MLNQLISEVFFSSFIYDSTILNQTLRPKNRFFIPSSGDYLYNPKGIIPSWLLPEHALLLNLVPLGGYGRLSQT